MYAESKSQHLTTPDVIDIEYSSISEPSDESQDTKHDKIDGECRGSNHTRQ